MWHRAVAHPLVRDRAQTLCGAAAVRAAATLTPAHDLDSVLQPVAKKNDKQQKINRAMKAYLERAQRRETFMKEKREEFELGKRHLANIMGWDREEITQEDVDEAIAYLLPSGLFEPKARPLMKPPEEMFAKQKLAEFDYKGRPFNYLFYTTKGNFYSILHDAVSQLIRLDQHDTQMRKKGVRSPDPKEKFDMVGYKWINKDDLTNMCLERIGDDNYDYFVRTMERLKDHPYSKSATEFLLRFLQHQSIKDQEQSILPLMHDEAGNPYMEARGERKSARAKVRVTGNGTGVVRINGSLTADEYFLALKDRIQLMFPLQFAGLLNKVDIDATVFYKHDDYNLGEMAQLDESELEGIRKPLQINRGTSCEAGAIRLAVAKALCSFVPQETVKLMRLSGLLTKDVRKRERKKPGQRGARRKYPWRKR